MTAAEQAEAIALLRRWRRFVLRIGSMDMGEPTADELTRITRATAEYEVLTDDTDDFLNHRRPVTT